MSPKRLAIVSMCLILSAVNARADDATTRQEIEQLKQRIEKLEKLQRQPETAASEGVSKIDKKVSLGGVVSGAYQYEWVDGPSDPGDSGRGALAIQPQVGITPTPADEILFKFGFAAGNGLNGVTAFNLAPWASDLENDVKNINGRDRDYLLTAWYKHRFEFDADHGLGLTGGLIDATDYMDENAYSNDEYTQFMNEALVNAPNTILPSYDIGGALEWNFRPFEIAAVYMNVGENDDGNNFNFFGTQLMYTLERSGGQGHYRIAWYVTSDAFLDAAGTSKKRRHTLIASLDQAFGEVFGAWIRLALQDDSAAVDYKGLYSGGINVNGSWWGRAKDNLGIGYAFVDGAEQTPDGICSSQVAEAYVNFGLNAYLSVTLDLQYIQDRYAPAASGSDVKGWIAGVRATAEF